MKNKIYICIKEVNEPYLVGFKFKVGKKYQLVDSNSAFVLICEVARPIEVFLPIYVFITCFEEYEKEEK